MNRRDDQIAELAARTSGLKQERLASFYQQIRDAYKAESIVERVAILNQITDRTPSDFRILSNSELRRLEHFNSDSYYWDMYCKELGRSVALGEEAYLFELLQAQLSESEVNRGVEFEGLYSVIEEMAAEGYVPDVVLMPISYMVGFSMDRRNRIEWQGGRHLLWNNRRLELIRSSRSRPLNRFIVFDHGAGIWNVKLDPRSGDRLTVGIGEQVTPVRGVLWVAETVAKYGIKEQRAFRSFRPDVAPDSDFGTVR